MPALVRQGDWRLHTATSGSGRLYVTHWHSKVGGHRGDWSRCGTYNGDTWDPAACNKCGETPPKEMQGFINLMSWDRGEVT